ncbi:hypothetical protein X927_00950 [Petrotoga mexicana DSM 14811]|uniref:Methylenetetrahydrofolate reductase (NAD(P)H) n=1 Tax=Petrotoga mexicana DSM 14811 TaxID=1122954 RepID=A0A2K1PEL6_9BACT|nr:hypothetical protein X927_00950 [Petrotoga mexicana DSM 14811]
MIEQLLEGGVPGVHIFTMGKGKIVKDILSAFNGAF